MKYSKADSGKNKSHRPASKSGTAGRSGTEAETFLGGTFWREHALRDIIPYWHEHIRDEKHGAFYTNLSQEGQPLSPWDKVPAMISRQVFGFSAAYLLFGEMKYLEIAREGADYLMEHAWDKKNGGWFDRVTQSGEPKANTKNISLQLYTNVGLTLYYFTTGDNKALSHIKNSIEIQQTHGHDNEFEGYYQELNMDLSVKDSGKNKHAHFGYVGSLLLNLWLCTRSAEILKWESHLSDLSLNKMTDDRDGWINGYISRFDRQWNLIPGIVNGAEVVHMGAQLTAALSFLRLYHQTGRAVYLEKGKALGDMINRYGWEPENGGWLELVERTCAHRPASRPEVQWWIQIYGSFLQLQLYRLTGDDQYLERFKKSEDFFFRYFIDREHGSIFSTVSPEGALIGDAGKAREWRTSYHEMEHALLNHLYVNLYVNRDPATLHFMFENTGSREKHFVSLIDDPSVQIAGVKINGRPWTQFDASERSVILPEGKNLKVEVLLK